ncbi:E3 SUMO-protein ligase ZBED1-like [Pterocles gutturalis]
MAGNSAGPAAWRRKREKGGGPAGGSAALDRRKSKVWNYYTKLGDAYVECGVCRKQLSFHNSTTTMREHLARKHSIRPAPLPPLKDEPDEAVTPENVAKRSRQTTPESAGHRAEPRRDDIAELLLEMIFRDLQPLSVVTDKGFGHLVGFLEPNLALPTPAQLAGMLWQRYVAARQRLERQLQAAEAVVLCAERWAWRLGHDYVTLAATFIDGEWRRARCVLETRAAREDEAEGGLPGALAGFGLCEKSVLCVVHDGAAVNNNARRPRGWSGVGCAARTLQRCVQAGLEVEAVREALGSARGVVRYFQQDAEAACSLSGKLETVNNNRVKLVLDAARRWLSTLEMCERLLELKWAVTAALEESRRGAAGGRNLADHQWKVLQDLVPVLRTIKIAAAFLGEEQNISASALMPCVHGIVAAIGQQAEDVGAVVKTVVSKIRAELTQRWGLAEEEKALENPAVIASFLDPRFKELRFLSPASRSELHARVKNMLSQIFRPQSPPAAPFWMQNSDYKAESGDSGSQSPAAKERCSGAASQSLYDILLGKDPTESMPEIHRQLENYIVEPLCKRSTDPLHWWKSNQHRFPAVARLSRQYLAVPATAVPPHQAFGTGESVLEHRRAGLEPENLDQILFLHQNYDFLESMRNSNESGSRNLQ